MPPSMPQELISAIIDMFKDDRRTLCTLGLVARSFDLGTRSHLFNPIFLEFGEKPNIYYKRYHRLKEILRARSHLATVVKRIVVRIGQRPSRKTPDPTLEVLQCIPRVTHLKITGGDWMSLPLAYKAALQARATSEDVTSLSIRDVEGLDINLLTETTVKELELASSFLCNTGLISPSNPDAVTSEPPSTTSHTLKEGALRSLRIVGCGGMIQALMETELQAESTLRIAG